MKNNNPLNIRRSSDIFKGESLTAGPFKKFVDNIHGYRAGMRILKTYINKYHLDTIEKILHRYAPEFENPTNEYIDFVCSRTGLSRDEKIEFTSDYIVPIVAAMTKFEQGKEADLDEVEKGWEII